MPLTPFHLGLGAAAKAIAPSRFSFTVFAFAQLVTDAEVMTLLLLGRYPIHGLFHTYLGATFVAVASLILGPPMCRRLKREWNTRLDPSLRARLTVGEEISFPAAIAGAFVGTYSHVFLDSFMHPDVLPFAPFSSANPLLGRISVLVLHLLCVAAGMVGLWTYLRRPGGQPSLSSSRELLDSE